MSAYLPTEPARFEEREPVRLSIEELEGTGPTTTPTQRRYNVDLVLRC